jgi:hypothetical protein
MDASDLAAFNTDRIAAQYGLYGVSVTIGSTACTVCRTAIAKGRVLDAYGNFMFLADTMLKVRKTELATAPADDSFITVAGVRLKVVRTKDHPQSGEWVIYLEGPGK